MTPAHSFNPDHSLRGFDGLLRETAPAPFPGDRGDGYHANDPDAPAPFRCDCCDAVRHTETAFCTDCNAVTGSYVGGRFATLARYANDLAFRARRDAETQHCRDAVNAQFDVIRDADLIRLGFIDAPAIDAVLSGGDAS